MIHCTCALFESLTFNKQSLLLVRVSLWQLPQDGFGTLVVLTVSLGDVICSCSFLLVVRSLLKAVLAVCVMLRWYLRRTVAQLFHYHVIMKILLLFLVFFLILVHLLLRGPSQGLLFLNLYVEVCTLLHRYHIFKHCFDLSFSLLKVAFILGLQFILVVFRLF